MKFKFKRDNPLLLELKRLHYISNILYEVRNNTSYRMNNVASELRTKGRFDVRNNSLETPEDIVAFAKIFRDSRYETFRIVYVKNNQSIGQDAVTCKLTGATGILHKFNNTDNLDLDKSFHYYENKFKKLNADGYYLLHNHPSGDVTPSREDINITDYFKNELPGLIDHIIVGKNKAFSVINNTEILLDDNIYNKSDVYFTNQIEARNFIKSLNHEDSDSILIYCDIRLEVVAIQDIKNSEFNDRNIRNWIKKEKINNGCDNCFIVTSNWELFNNCSMSLMDNLLTDCFYETSDGGILSAIEISRYDSRLVKNVDKIKYYNM